MRAPIVAIGLVFGCAAQPGTLRIDVKTDLVPQVEFETIRITDLSTGFTTQTNVADGQSWIDCVSAS